MRVLAVLVLSLVSAGLALAPRSAAQELAELSLEGFALEPSLPDRFAERPAVGVEGSAALRLDEPRRVVFRDPHPAVPFADQLASGLGVFHLPVYFDDPKPSRAAPFAAAGLKVGSRGADDEAAACVTLMLCLAALDDLARDGGSEPPLVVVIDATPPARAPRSLPVRAVRAVPEVIPDAVREAVWSEAPRQEPTWALMLAEVATALPDADPSRLVLVLTGAAGEPPDPVAWLGDRADVVLLDGAAARVLRGDDDPETIGEAAMSGAFTVVIGADWSGEGDPARLGPREAARSGAHAVVVTPLSARQGGLGRTPRE